MAVVSIADRGSMALHRRTSGRLVLNLLAVLLVLLTVAPAVADDGSTTKRSFVVYLQQSFPKQTNTNNQIEEINNTFGVNFDTWDDVVNLSVGGKLFWQVSPRWQVGAELDYSAGKIDGSATVDTAAGPAQLAFRQEYDVFADVLAVAHYFPWPEQERVRAFILLGLGVAYEKDETTLTLTNEYIDEWLRVDNDGFFPAATLGVGVNIPLRQGGRWYFEGGVAHFWGRLDHHVAAEGPLAPAPEVRADTDSTGPNYWLGLGKRF